MGDNTDLSHRIIGNLRMCGHFLYFKMGDRAGRRKIFAALLQNGSMPQKEIQDMLGIKSGSISEMLAKIEAEGLIEREKSKKDKRQVNLKLTEEGRRQAALMKEAFDQRSEIMMECFSDKEKTQLALMLEKLNKHWAQMTLSEGPPPFPKPRYIKDKEVKT